MFGRSRSRPKEATCSTINTVFTGSVSVLTDSDLTFEKARAKRFASEETLLISVPVEEGTGFGADKLVCEPIPRVRSLVSRVRSRGETRSVSTLCMSGRDADGSRTGSLVEVFGSVQFEETSESRLFDLLEPLDPTRSGATADAACPAVVP
jgi:hypothetical protein